MYPAAARMAIDATAGGPDDAFVFGGTTATAHGVWYSVSGGDATVYVDTDGITSTAELSFTLTGVTTLTQGDDFSFDGGWEYELDCRGSRKGFAAINSEKAYPAFTHLSSGRAWRGLTVIWSLRQDNTMEPLLAQILAIVI